MSELATIEHERAPAAPVQAKRERIPARIRHACALLASGECRTIKAAAERAGLSREHLSRMISRPHIQAFIDRKCRQTIATGKLRASHRLMELVDAASEHVSLDAAKHVLAVEGIRPPDQSQPLVNIAITPGYIVRLDKARPVSLMGQERETGPNPLIEHASVSHRREDDAT